MTTTERILTAGAMPMVPQRELARELGMSVPGLMQRMLQLATDPEVRDEFPALCEAVNRRRDGLRVARSAARLQRVPDRVGGLPGLGG